MQAIKAISNEITKLEAVRDYSPEEFTREDHEMLAIIYLCYDLLTRTAAISKLETETPTEMMDYDGDDSPTMPQYGQMNDYFTDFVFAIATKNGKVSFRRLLKHLVFAAGETQKSLAAKLSIRTASISEYLNHKSGGTTDTYEKLINHLISKK